MALLTEQAVFPWVEKTLGAKIDNAERQGGRESGGRPGWFVTMAGNAAQQYYVRGTRGEEFGFNKVYGLQREAEVLRLLHQEGIDVPEVIATSVEPNAVIMEFVAGENDFTLIESSAERDAVAKDFARIMARWHAIPAKKFVEIGFDEPIQPADFIVKDLQVWEAGHFPNLKKPVPLVTFACQWLRRNLPEPPQRSVLVQGDTGPGQFLFASGKVTSVVDWELANLGDPMRELAHIRTRDVWYPTHNLPDWFRYYSEFSGTPLDYDKIRYYSVIGMLTTALALGPVVQVLDPQDEHAEWIAQDIWSRKATAEAIADVSGITLEDVQLPDEKPSHTSNVFDALEKNLREEHLPAISDNWQQHRLQITLRLLAHARQLSTIGPEIQNLELDDMAGVLGERPQSVDDGQRGLDKLVRESGPERDAELTHYFYRHAVREKALMQGGMGRAAEAMAAAVQ